MRRLLVASLFWIAALVSVPPLALAEVGDALQPSQVRQAIVAILSSQNRLPLPIERIRAALVARYSRDKSNLYWIGTGRMTPFLQHLQNAAADGLNPDDYPADGLVALRDAPSSDLQQAVSAELYFSAFLVAYATDLKAGRLAPQKVDPSLFRDRKVVDPYQVLSLLSRQSDPNAAIAAFEPKNPPYQNLKRILALYRAAARGTWPSVATGPDISPGGSDSRLPLIRRLLAAVGDYQGADSGSTTYDSATVAAMQHFQLRHGLEAKGKIGKQTILAMNIPPAERARQIMLNMERWRWMPDDLGSYHFLVNLAAFELQQVQQTDVVDRMKVVVGAVATQTPEFSDRVSYVELNPYWTVPYSIATTEMLGKLRSNPMAYADDFDVFMNGQQVGWGGIGWAAYGPGNFPFTFRQRPGPKNALGKVKFMLPNVHNIYLHDSPAKDKFLQTARAFSHGCIRLSRPIDLAYTVLGQVPGWSKDRVDQVLAGGRNTQIVLPQKIPVHLIYATAFYGANGIEFRPDVYGRDRKLYAALFGKPAS